MTRTPTLTCSHSELDTYRQCRLKHQLTYIERWRTDEEAEALTRGTLFHSVMEAHYGRLKDLQRHPPIVGVYSRHDRADPSDVAVDLYAAVSHLLYDRETGQQSERQALVEWIYRGYVDLYGIDRGWKVCAVEMPMDEPLVGRDGLPTEYRLAGTVDLLVEDWTLDGGLWLVDHKTCKNLPKQKDFDMEDQTGIYAYLLSLQGYDIRGAIYNHCRTMQLKRDMTPEDRFLRHRTVRTIQELETMAIEAMELMQEAYENHQRRAQRGVYDAPRSPDGERCGWKCNLTEACLVGRKSGPERTRQFLVDIGFEQKDTKPGPTFNKERPA